MLDKYNINVFVLGSCNDDNTIINQKLDQIMANIQELTAQVDDLHAALDAEQAEILAAIEALNTTVAELQALVATGGTEAERQALADKISAIKDDLVATIPSATIDPTPEV